MFNELKAFEVTDGIALDESGACLFTGSGDPTGSAPDGSRYYDKDNPRIWSRDNGVWVLHFDGDIRPRNTVTIFISDTNGENISTGSYGSIAFKPVAGPDLYINPTYTFGSVGQSSSGGELWVRIVRKDTGAQLAELYWDNITVPTFKSAVMTLPPNGINLLEVQCKRANGTGKLYSSGIEVVNG